MKRRGGRGRRSGAAPAAQPRHTSHPTTRAAYAETRRWLLKEHGPVCAYCARTFKPAEMTLDHVAPRRGQSAYDRRDNLVLACKTCNAAKADQPLLAFLLRNRDRAVSLARYGVHLSTMLREMVVQIAENMGEHHRVDTDSPYADVPYVEPLRPYRDISDEAHLHPAPVGDTSETASAASGGGRKSRRPSRRRRR